MTTQQLGDNTAAAAAAVNIQLTRTARKRQNSHRNSECGRDSECGSDRCSAAGTVSVLGQRHLVCTPPRALSGTLQVGSISPAVWIVTSHQPSALHRQ